MAVPYAFRKRHEERNHHRPRQIRVISRPSAEQNPDGKDDRHKQNPTVNGKIKHTLQLHSKSLLSETRPLIGMASVDKRRPPKRRALRHAGRRSLPFGHSLNGSYCRKTGRRITAGTKRAVPARRRPYGDSPSGASPGKGAAAGEGFPPTRASVSGEIPPPARVTSPTKVPSASVSPRRPPMRVPARQEFRHGEDAGPLQRGYRPNENAALTFFREALSSSAPAGKTLPIAPPRFSKTLSRLMDDSALDKERISANRVGLFLRKRCAAILLQPITRHIRRTQTFQKAGEAFCTEFLRIPLPEQDAQFRHPLNDRSGIQPPKLPFGHSHKRFPGRMPEPLPDATARLVPQPQTDADRKAHRAAGPQSVANTPAAGRGGEVRSARLQPRASQPPARCARRANAAAARARWPAARSSRSSAACAPTRSSPNGCAQRPPDRCTPPAICPFPSEAA